MIPRYFSGIDIRINKICDKKYIPMTQANTNPNRSADNAPAVNDANISPTVFKKPRTLEKTTTPVF